MKLKLAIIYGILTWIITLLLTKIANSMLAYGFHDMNITVPIIIIIVTGFFGILYIRNFDENEVIEGLNGGVIFIIIDVILDYIFFLNLKISDLMFTDYKLHLFSTIILTLLITTFLGYLAQMNVDLK